MDNKKTVVGFIGAGGIARSHVYSLSSLKYFYDDAPEIELAAVSSAKEESRKKFAARFGFSKALNLDEFLEDERIDTVFILGPNNVHFEHFKAVLSMKSLKRIYLEKPVCSSPGEMKQMPELAKAYPDITIQVGFQYLFTSAVREALALWKSGIMGKPVHFDFQYYHSDYLKPEYRRKRVTRLTPAPDGGAMADLGSHVLSLILAFMGDDLKITGAVQAGQFDDVPEGSDLFSQITIYDKTTHAAGTLSSSRISSGTGDYLSFVIYAEKGALKYVSSTPDIFDYFLESDGHWSRQTSGSNYRPITSFPSGHVPPGWHRSMMHAHYIFLKGASAETFVPDLKHGLEVQNMLNLTAEHLEIFRKLRGS
ncbi:MAG TPA: Gfo/Idh/MocA family oxidoreductase [Bacteroidales bacterium]|jgi:predicted dehydrogenase|nr:Gfo/Idh/MocA family oxidoreductase [Bacteroidales bacterium]